MACRVYRADLGSGFAQFRAPSGIKTSSNSIGFGHFAQYVSQQNKPCSFCVRFSNLCWIAMYTMLILESLWNCLGSVTPSIILPRCLHGFGQFSCLEKFAAGPGGPDKERQSILDWCRHILVEKGDINICIKASESVESRVDFFGHEIKAKGFKWWNRKNHINIILSWIKNQHISCQHVFVKASVRQRRAMCHRATESFCGTSHVALKRAMVAKDVRNEVEHWVAHSTERFSHNSIHFPVPREYFFSPLRNGWRHVWAVYDWVLHFFGRARSIYWSMAKCLAANPAAATVADHPTTSVATLWCVGTRGLEVGHGLVLYTL